MIDVNTEIDDLWVDSELDKLAMEMASDIERQEVTTYEEDMFVEKVKKKYDEDPDKLVKAYNAGVENGRKIAEEKQGKKVKRKKVLKNIGKTAAVTAGSLAAGVALSKAATKNAEKLWYYKTRLDGKLHPYKYDYGPEIVKKNKSKED